MKDELRKKYKLIRKNIINKEYLDNIIFKKVIKNQQVKDAKTILIYVSNNYEIDTIKLITYFFKENKLVAVPKIENNEMNFYYINNLEELENGYFDILEPIANNRVNDFNNCISITPGICFSKNGYRIGYGKGFYDQFYSKYQIIHKIGLCYKACLIDNFKFDKFDQKVDEIITD